MIIDYFFLAFGNLRHRGIRSWLTMLGIFIGIAAVVSLISMGDGLRSAITGQFGDLGADKIAVQNAGTGFGPPGSTAVVKLTQHDLDIVQSVPGVDNAVSRLIRISIVKYNKEVYFGYLGSMPDNDKDIKLIYDTMNVKVQQGRLLTASDRRNVVVGSDYAGKIFDRNVRIGSTLNIQGENFNVVGILTPSSTFIMNQVILMSESDMKSILNISDEIDLIAVQVTNKDVVEQTANAIENALRKDRKEKVGEEDFSVQTPQQALQAVNTVLNIINIVIAGIAAISLLVGGIGITNTMYTAVLERTKEIGVMKAVGAKNRDVLSIFIIESSMLGLAGGIIGAVIGLLMAIGISFGVQSAFPGLNFSVAVNGPLLAEAVIFSLSIGTLSGIVPAMQASKMRPVEALRS
jgi:putative ABC transport system permease protein